MIRFQRELEYFGNILAYQMMNMKLKHIPTFSHGDNAGTIHVNL